MKIKKLLFFFLICLLLGNNSGIAQITFQKTYGGPNEDNGGSATQTFDSGYIITGSIRNLSGISDLYLIKTDSIGDTTWTKTFGGFGNDRGYSVIQTTDGGYVVLGITYSFGAGQEDIYLIRTDANGNLIWSKTYGWLDQDIGLSIKQTYDGGFIFTGGAWYLGGSSGNHIYLVKTNSLGDTLWTRVISPQLSGAGTGVIQTADSGFAVTGNLGSDVCLARLNIDGTLLWTKTYGGTGQDEGLSIQQTTDSGFIISSTAYSFGGGYKVYLVKTDSTGGLVWSKAFGVGGSGAPSVQQTFDGGYVVAGFLDCPIGDRNVYLIKTDAFGDTLWTRMFGGTSGDWGWSVKQTLDGGYIIAGTTYSFEPNGEIYLIKTDSNGISGCNESICSISVSNPPTQVGTPINSVASGGIVTVPVTNPGSGGIATTLCLNTALNDLFIPNKTINIYPNPSNGNFTLSSNNIGYLKIVIYNILGEIVYLEEIANVPINISKQIQLNSVDGIYLVKIQSGVEYYCNKIIVE